ncbi:MAG: glutamine synthetase type III [Clostridiales bacterium]|jgi:glutamine synthetase|nr:glutamine synthetase type III [Clostridiales bacterium]
MKAVPEMFGCLVFNEKVMQERLPKDTYKLMKKSFQDGKRMSLEVATVVANAMKDWAIENGATHYTHWFQPMTGITAEKHDSFISPTDNGGAIMEFSGKELVRGEPDASSFPSGGLRATFEARGYTAWDPTSYAFIKEGSLCIPTAFCSYGGEALDQKTPLLRSMEALSKQALRVLKLFGNDDVTGVKTTVGPEQEYFLISREMYEARKDLIYTGRTLFGCKPPKGQEMDDHYFGTLKPAVSGFMADLDETLWKLGVLAKTKHNEVAPAQHELAPIFTTSNIAVDHNQLTMEMMKKVAERHGMVCLLHEKPFEGVNGSGKHNNWSMITNTGANLLEPGQTPYENAQFLLFLCAVIKAVDEYQDMLRISVASAANDHRLGAHEAPPAVMSIFVGDELMEILEAIEMNRPYDSKETVQMKIGVHVLPKFPKDNTDRNRTSPFAFTGNRFEFRMAGSSQSIASPNTVLNTAVAEELRLFAEELEDAKDFTLALHNLIRKTIGDHKRILFNGNGYDDCWLEEAKRRNLSNLKTTPEALTHLLDEKNIALFTTHKVFSELEMKSRYEINLESYCKTLNIEALTMIDMAKHDIFPAVSAYAAQLAANAAAKGAFVSCTAEKKLIEKISARTDSFYDNLEKLETALAGAEPLADSKEAAFYYKDKVLSAMQALRADADALEQLTAADFWPYPSYGDMLFSIK